MGLYRWKCTKCNEIGRKILPVRPKLDKCVKCGGEQVFDTQVVGTVYETIDNGLMAKKVTWVKGAADMIDQHADLPDEEEPGII